MFSYLKNAEALGVPYRYAEGILLYPAVGDRIAFGADIQGHHIRICTVKLDQPWQIIRSDLLAVIGLPVAPGMATAASFLPRLTYGLTS